MNLTERLFEIANLGAEWVLWLLVGLSLASVAVIAERAFFMFRVAVGQSGVDGPSGTSREIINPSRPVAPTAKPVAKRAKVVSSRDLRRKATPDHAHNLKPMTARPLSLTTFPY